MEFDFFGHGKSWKVMEFELPKRVWTLEMYLTPTLNWTQSQTGEDNLFLNVTILPVANQWPDKSATK